MYGENTKYHGNPYIQGTTVPCDTSILAFLFPFPFLQSLYEIFHLLVSLFFYLSLTNYTLITYMYIVHDQQWKLYRSSYVTAVRYVSAINHEGE